MKRQSEKRADVERERLANVVAVFSVLAYAQYQGRFHEAAQAQAELERLGVSVQFKQPTARQGVANER